MTGIEIFASLAGVANILLLIRRSVWNYPFAILMVALYFRVFLDAKLYSDALLQLFFLAINIWGWVHWRRVAQSEGEVVVGWMRGAARAQWLGGIAAVTIGWGWLMHRFTDAHYPWWDAAVAIPSVAAQTLLAKRRIENWLLWIAVDVTAIGLYAAKGLWPTTALYMLFLIMSVWGLIQWRSAAFGNRAA